MSVSITFEPSGISGLVAEGTYLIDAARRMGASLGAGCTAGKGECPACVVSVKTGADLLSQPSVAEEKQLGVEHLDQSLRLACQVKIENHGEVVVMVAARPQYAPRLPADTEAELRKNSARLPLEQKDRDALAVRSHHDVGSFRLRNREATRVRIENVRLDREPSTCDTRTKQQKK